MRHNINLFCKLGRESVRHVCLASIGVKSSKDHTDDIPGK